MTISIIKIHLQCFQLRLVYYINEKVISNLNESIKRGFFLILDVGKIEWIIIL